MIGDDRPVYNELPSAYLLTTDYDYNRIMWWRSIVKDALSAKPRTYPAEPPPEPTPYMACLWCSVPVIGKRKSAQYCCRAHLIQHHSTQRSFLREHAVSVNDRRRATHPEFRRNRKDTAA